jgi:hypothetical protein
MWPPSRAKDLWARLPGVRSEDIPLEHGGTYRLSAWLRAKAPDTPVELGFTAHIPKAPHWFEMRRVTVGPEWSRHEVIAKVPERAPAIDRGYLRFRLAREAGVMFVDDVELHRIELLDEWAAWQAAGWDRHSVIADPLFVAADQDDYRLRDQSPASRLGIGPESQRETRSPANPTGHRPRP